MNGEIVCVWSIALALRVASLVVSRRNEKRLKAAGAMEDGRINSIVLAVLHGVFYIACLAEAAWRGASLDRVGIVGLFTYAVAMLCLLWIVRELGPLWTVKLILAQDHTLRTTWLFRTFRHPNYVLNIIPELLGLMLICKAWIAGLCILPFYAVSLTVRVRQEERVMRARFAEY